jgi:preprotein translocase subunit YajC
MTGTQSRTLKIGARVCWDSGTTDQGTVSAVDWTDVTIKWDNGHTNTLFHNDIAQVERSR